MTTRQLASLTIAGIVLVGAAASADPLSVFQPTQVRAVSVSPADVHALEGLPPLDAFGTIRGTRVPGVDEEGSAADAASAAGYALRLPSDVPASIGHDVRYQVSQRIRTTFTFDAARAAAWARDHKVALHAIPPNLNGATYTALVQPIAVVTYGTPPRGRRGERGIRRTPFLAVMQGPVPTVTSTGASIATLADWFAAQPGVPRHLVAQIKAIGDPAQTLPIPIRFDKQTASDVTVDGVHGLAIGDETGIGSAVVWTKDGKLFAVGGTLSQSELRAVVASLK